MRYFYVSRTLIHKDGSTTNIGSSTIKSNGHFNLKEYIDSTLLAMPGFNVCVVTFFTELNEQDYINFQAGY